MMTPYHGRRPSELDCMGADFRTVSLESDTSAHSYTIEMQPSSDSPRPADERRRSAEGRHSAESRRSSEQRGSEDSGGSGRSAFAADDVQATPIPRDSLDGRLTRQNQMERSRSNSSHPPAMPSLDERHASLHSAGSLPTPRTRMDAYRGYRQQLGTRGAFSLDMGQVPPEVAHRSGLRVSVDLPPVRTNADGAVLPVYEALEGRLVRRRRRLPIQWVVFFGVVSSACLVIACTTLSIGIYNFSKLRTNRAQKSVDALEQDLLPIFGNITGGLTAVQLGVATLLARAGGYPQGPPP